MAENLMNSEHKANSQAYRNSDFWKPRCEYHGCRHAVSKKDGIWLCEDCQRTLSLKVCLPVEAG